MSTAPETENPPPPIPPRVLLLLFVLFFVVPGICCMGCISVASLFPTPAERSK
jgi:hypothetical protein